MSRTRAAVGAYTARRLQAVVKGFNGDGAPLSGNAQGALWMIASCIGASFMTVAIRYLAEDLDTRMIAFLRCALGVLLVAPWVLDGGLSWLKISRPWLHLLRGVLMACALNLGFFAISSLPMATVSILFFLAPIFATTLAVPMLGEAVGMRRWAAVAAGFLGAMILLRPGFGPLEWGMIAAIASAACFSVSLLLSKILGPVDGARSLLLTSTAIAGLLTLPIALPVWQMPPDGIAWIWIAVLITTSTFRMYADIRAYSVGDVGFIAPFAYLRLVFVAALGWLLFRETIDQWTLAGGTVIVASTLYIARREAQLNKRIAGGSA
ncbi:MAG: DMT family transporter [Rhodobacteraceae bacterium]|nr:DMT family transporter [Paracoccaceae bacterium]